MTKKKTDAGIKFDQHNFRLHSGQNKQMIRKSLSECGAGRSVLIDNEGELIAGNGVYEQAQALGIPTRIIETDGTELVVVKRTDLSTQDDKRKKLAFADNAASDAVEWNVPEIQANLDPIVVAEFGVTLPEVAAEEPEASEDDFDETQDEVQTRVQRGEIWQLGEHRLMCGDSTSQSDVAQLMGGALADMWLTDPPYNIDYTGGTSEHLKIQNDKQPDEAFRQFLTDAYAAAFANMRMGGAYYIWHAPTESYNFRAALLNLGMRSRETLVWNKNAITLGRQDYQWKHESCLYGWKDGAPHYFRNVRNEPTVLPDAEELNIDKMSKADMRDLLHRIYDSDIPTTVIDEKKPAVSAEHPTMKPVRLFARLIKNSSRQGELVLDTFGGSGTTIVACEQMGRKCYTMELDPHYCDVIIARWEKLTGKTATKIQ